MIAIGCVGLFFFSFMFKTTLVLWLKFALILLQVVKWLFVVGFLVSFVNLPQVYEAFGWTPLSALAGPQFYERLKQQK